MQVCLWKCSQDSTHSISIVLGECGGLCGWHYWGFSVSARRSSLCWNGKELCPGQQEWGLASLWASQINNFKVQKSEMGVLDAGPPLLLPLTYCLQYYMIHLWSRHGLWSVSKSIFGLWVILDDTVISAERWFCWKGWLGACFPSCRCFLLLFLPGKETIPWTRFESVSCRSCGGALFEFLQACRAKAPQRQLTGNKRVGYSPAELACFATLKSSYGYKQLLFHTVIDFWNVCAKYSGKDKHSRDYKIECGVTEREPKKKGKLKCAWQILGNGEATSSNQ